jgi:nucleotide-binding universal stress UspA family protein
MSFTQNILITINIINGYNETYLNNLQKKLLSYTNSQLFLLYVLDRTDFFNIEFPHALSKFLSEQNYSLTQAKEKLNQFGGALNVAYEHRILAQGNPSRIILNEASLLKTDLIILGNHSPSPSDVVGKTCQYITEHAPCDVLALHIPAGQTTSAFLRELPPQTQASAA